MTDWELDKILKEKDPETRARLRHHVRNCEECQTKFKTLTHKEN